MLAFIQLIPCLLVANLWCSTSSADGRVNFSPRNSAGSYSCNRIMGLTKTLKNTVFVNDPYSPSAIQASADNSTFSCNETNNTYTGILMQSVCNTAVLQGSTIGTHHFGLNFTNSLSLQAQTDRSNTWADLSSYTGTDKAARHEGTSMVGLAGVFKTSSSVPFKPTNNLISVTGTVTIPQWFQPGLTPSVCTQVGNTCTPRPLALTEGTGDATLQQLIASDVPTTETYEIEQLWESQKQLYETLKSGDAAVYLTDPILSNFVAEKEQESIGQFYEVKEQTSNAFTPGATLKLQLAQYETQISNLTTQINGLDADYTAGNLSETDWQTQRTTVLTLLGVATTQYKVLNAQFEAVRDAGIDVVKNINDLIVVAEVYEANTKSVNDIYLRTVAKENSAAMNATDKATIDYISSQCPYTGGTAVYVARALQASIRKDTFYNDTENCFAQGVHYRIVKPKDEVKTVDTDGNNIKLYPNPTTNFVVIKSNKALTGRLNVLNSIGQVVSTLGLQGQKDLIISTSDLPEGIYFVNTYDEQGIYFKEKLIIIKQ